jgi:glyceraldehyde-3-phosphate dehydrogenase (ferredoxin)
VCRFHRAWAEDLLPEIVERIFGQKEALLQAMARTASRINSRNASIFWESARNTDLVFTFLKNKKEVDGVQDPDLDQWIARFEKDRSGAAFDFWYDMHKGIHESLREFPD